MPTFEIVEVLAGGKTRPYPAGLFPDGTSAASVLASLKAQHPTKNFQPRPIKDETSDWRAREQRRFDEGVYQPLNLGLEPIKDHFAYRALKTPTNVAFTRTPEHGKMDRQVSVHIRSYLNEFYPNLSIEEKRKIIFAYCGEDYADGVMFAKTEDEITEVYKNGPGSCMSGPFEGMSHHPSAVYAGPDTEVAYIKNDRGRISARAVVCPERKIYYLVYGDSRLVEGLKELGYKESDYDDWYGVRLNKIEFSGYYDDYEDEYVDGGDEDTAGYVCAYIDFASYVKVEGDYLVVCPSSDRGSVGCKSTCGVIS